MKYWNIKVICLFFFVTLQSHMWMTMNNDEIQKRLESLPPKEQLQFEFFSSTTSLEPTQLS